MTMIRIKRHRWAFVVAVALVLAITCPVAGCRGAAGASTAISAGVASDVELLRTMDAETAAALFPSGYTDRLVAAGIDPSLVYGALFARLQCSVEGVSISDDGATAIARLAVTNVDVMTALANYSQMLSQELYERGQLADADPSFALKDDEYARLLATTFVSALGDPALASVTTRVEVTYRLQDGIWTCVDRDGLASALLGGLDADELALILS